MFPKLPDLNYRIDPATRARVAPHFDAQALERLVQHLPADAREAFLEHFLVARSVSTDVDGSIPDVTVLTRISDPVQQSLLEEVWQPFWRLVPVEALDDPHSPWPGRELALRRRHGETGT